MDTQLDATVRDASRGKSGARKVRQAGKLPAVLYGRNQDATPITVDPKELSAIFRTSQNRNTVVHLQIDDDSVPCLVREVQRHPLHRDLLHVDFYRLEDEQEVEVEVPLVTEGKPAGVAEGGRLRVIARKIEVRCKWTDIPEAIVIDVSPLEVNDFIRVSDLEAPGDAEVIYETDYNVITVYGKQALVLDLPELEGPEEEEAEELLEGEEAEEGEEGEDDEGDGGTGYLPPGAAV